MLYRKPNSEFVARFNMVRNIFTKKSGYNDKGVRIFKTDGIEFIIADLLSGINYAAVGFVYYRQREYKKAIKWYEKALKVDPSVLRKSKLYGGYITLSDAYKKVGDHKKAVEYANKDESSMDWREKKSRLHPHRDIREWVKADFKEMVEICRLQGIPVIMQTYPSDAYSEHIISINQAIREAANELGVAFVDQQELFIEFSDSSGVNSDDYFELPASVRSYIVGGGHCNRKGYRLMAENLYDKIQEEEIFTAKAPNSP